MKFRFNLMFWVVVGTLLALVSGALAPEGRPVSGGWVVLSLVCWARAAWIMLKE